MGSGKDSLTMVNTILSKEQNDAAIRKLAETDPDIFNLISRIGLPHFWIREPGFTGLLKIILEQQVSLASAKAVFEKLSISDGKLTTETFLHFDDEYLHIAGFSRQKMKYARILAEAIVNNLLNLEHISLLSDDEARNTLMEIKGIGRWTADCYLIFCMNRADVWPYGDLALNKALKVLKNLPAIPGHEESEKHADNWKPHRSAAARMLWHFYLSAEFPK